MKLIFNARLLWKGPVTTCPQTPAAVVNQQSGPLNLGECTCELCRNPGIRNQNPGAQQMDANK
jgi:hypothetical protein